MKRRKHLQLVASTKVSLPLPEEQLAAELETVIGKVWWETLTEPMIFTVSDSWTICFAEFNEPETRGDLLDICLSGSSSTRELMSIGQENYRAMDVLKQAYLDSQEADFELDDIEQIEDVDLAKWFLKDPENIRYARQCLSEWLADTDLNECDYEVANRYGATSQGAALCFWSEEPQLCELFDIAIIEGDHPGSTYYAAELHQPIEEANQLALEKGIPIRFVAE